MTDEPPAPAAPTPPGPQQAVFDAASPKGIARKKRGKMYRCKICGRRFIPKKMGDTVCGKCLRKPKKLRDYRRYCCLLKELVDLKKRQQYVKVELEHLIENWPKLKALQDPDPDKPPQSILDDHVVPTCPGCLKEIAADLETCPHCATTLKAPAAPGQDPPVPDEDDSMAQMAARLGMCWKVLGKDVTGDDIHCDYDKGHEGPCGTKPKTTFPQPIVMTGDESVQIEQVGGDAGMTKPWGVAIYRPASVPKLEDVALKQALQEGSVVPVGDLLMQITHLEGGTATAGPDGTITVSNNTDQPLRAILGMQPIGTVPPAPSDPGLISIQTGKPTQDIAAKMAALDPLDKLILERCAARELELKKRGPLRVIKIPWEPQPVAPHPDGTCRWCGGALSGKSTKYCSDQHRDLFYQATSTSRSVGWDEFCALVKKVKGVLCQHCGAEPALCGQDPVSDPKVWNIKAVKQGGREFDIANCIMLCSSCYDAKQAQGDNATLPGE